MRSTVTDSVVAFYPSPAGATESELALESWERLVAANPVLEQLDADAEALVVNRITEPAAVRDPADRPLLRAGRVDQVALGGDLRRVGDRAGRAGVLRADPRASGGGVVTLEQRPDRRAPARSSRSSGPPTSRSRPRRRCCFEAIATEPTGAAIQSIALTAQVMIDPARRGYDAGDAAAARPSCSVRRRRGRHPRAGCRGRGSRRPCPGSPARRGSRSRSRAPTTSRSRPPSTSTRSQDGEVPLTFHFNGNVFFHGADAPAAGDADLVDDVVAVPDAGRRRGGR